MADKPIVIRSLKDLAAPQVRAILSKAVIKGTGTCKPPPLDLEGIRARADQLDPKSQTKADIYRLLIEIGRLQKEIDNCPLTDWPTAHP